jgi:hypothetical protein
LSKGVAEAVGVIPTIGDETANGNRRRDQLFGNADR